MAKARKLYEMLGIAPGASLGDIRKAHREKVKARHPDTGGPEASTEEFQKIQHAYVVLRDEKRRAEYDATGIDPGEPVDLRESQVLGVLAGTLANLLAQPLESILANPVITVMRQVLLDEIGNTQKQQAECKRSIAKIERVMKRFRRKGQGENQLASLLRGQISQLEQSIAKGLEQISLREEARAMLADYEFDQELPVWVGGSGQASTTAGFGQGFGQYGLGNIFGNAGT